MALVLSNRWRCFKRGAEEGVGLKKDVDVFEGGRGLYLSGCFSSGGDLLGCFSLEKEVELGQGAGGGCMKRKNSEKRGWRRKKWFRKTFLENKSNGNENKRSKKFFFTFWGDFLLRFWK